MATVVSAILLALAVVLVVLTRLRLARSQTPAGRLDIPGTLVNLHTGLGSVALLLWAAFLFLDVDWLVGFLGLLLWWGTTAVGLLILMRWLPARGKHAADGAGDSWTQGPWLSMVGHLGALVGAVVWSSFFLAGSVG